MLFKDEQTGIEIHCVVTKKAKNVTAYKRDVKKGCLIRTRKRIIATRVQISLSHELSDEVETVLSAEAKQHVNDIYSQLEGKREVFRKILSKIKELNYDNDISTVYNTRKIRTAVWRIGEVFAGVRDKSTVFVDLPS